MQRRFLAIRLFLIGLFSAGMFVPFPAGSAWTPETYSLVRVAIPDPDANLRLQSLGLSLEEGVRRTTNSIELIANQRELGKIRQNGFSVEVLNDDMERYFRTRLQAQVAEPFVSGSMGGFYTFNETLNKLQGYVKKYPKIASPLRTIGTSIEGRPILAMKISDNPKVEDPLEEDVLYTALHHAREPQSLMTVLYFMEKLLSGYGKNPEITYLVNNRELWFVPVVNPDGYVHNEQVSPGGGGLWRKNRRANSDGTYGVDLNRNYGLMWGLDDVGSSRVTVDEIFRGTGPFSEPETIAVRDFVKARKFVLAVNYHSYRDLLLYPWSYQAGKTPHDRIFRQEAQYLTRINHYRTGNTLSVLGYPANGEASDWMYGDPTKNRVFAMTPEVGDFSDSFWPARDRILPLAQENYRANLDLAWIARGLPVVVHSIPRETSGNGDKKLQPGESGRLTVTLRNIGLRKTVKAVQVSLKGTAHIQVSPQSVAYGDLRPMKAASRNFSLTISASTRHSRLYYLELTIHFSPDLSRKEKVGVIVFK